MTYTSDFHAEAISFTGVFAIVCDFVHQTAVEKGWWGPDGKQRNFGESIARMHCELSEALEAWCDGDPRSEKIPEFTGIEEELADVVIRIMDLAGGLNLDVGGAIVAKIEYNKTRPFRHGGKRA